MQLTNEQYLIEEIVLNQFKNTTFIRKCMKKETREREE